MVTDAMRARFEQALADAQPYPALSSLAKSLQDEGIDQVTIYRLFSEYQATTDGSDPRYDAIVDTMDLIWGGPWAKRGDLLENELTGGDVT